MPLVLLSAAPAGPVPASAGPAALAGSPAPPAAGPVQLPGPAVPPSARPFRCAATVACCTAGFPCGAVLAKGGQIDLGQPVQSGGVEVAGDQRHHRSVTR